MPSSFLDDAERARFTHFPQEIDDFDLNIYFGLTEDDLAQISTLRGDHNRLGWALQLGALRYMGFFVDAVISTPTKLVTYVAAQLHVEVSVLSRYGQREQTRTDHARHIQQYLGFHDPTPADLEGLAEWLNQRALEHDRPLRLLGLLAERFKTDKLVRVGVKVLERMVASAREKAYIQTYQKLEPLLTSQCRKFVMSLLAPDTEIDQTRLEWLRQEAVSNTSRSIVTTLKKVNYLRQAGVAQWDLSSLNPNRLKWLAQLGRKTTPYLLERMSDTRRYPILLAFAAQSLQDITDETLELFLRCLDEAYRRAKHELAEFRQSVTLATDEKVRHFHSVGTIILSGEIEDNEVRSRVYTYLPQDKMEAAVADCARLLRPPDGSYFDYLLKSYRSLHAFAPAFLKAFTFHANPKTQPVLDAVEVLKQNWAEGKRRVSNHSTLAFVPARWKNYVLEDNGSINSQFYELCVLWELRAALRGGNIWVEGSRRHARLEGYLISPQQWPTLRPEVCRQSGMGVDGAAQLSQLGQELEAALVRLEERVGEAVDVRIENEELIVTSLEADLKPAGAVYLSRQLEARLPLVELVSLIMEVDQWTHYSRDFGHIGGGSGRAHSPEQRQHLFGAIVAQAFNLGYHRLARASDFEPQRLARTTDWYIREETLRPAITRLVNYQFKLPLAAQWGNGTLSSSDGQRFPVAVPNRAKASLPRYFGYGKGLTFYTWTADTHSQFGSKPIISTEREGTYMLDEILDNETELPLVEHTSDTAGYSELIFGLYAALGLQFSPRIRDVGQQRLYHLGAATLNGHDLLKFLFRGGPINQQLIVSQWDEILRLVGSLQLGYVSASLLITRLQALPQQNAVAQALVEYGRLVKTIFILRYLESKPFRHRIENQLNKGENIHSLRNYVFYGNHGEIRKRHSEENINQVSCLNVVVNCCIVWNTVYMGAVMEAVRAEGIEVDEADFKHLSPSRFEHINPFGRYSFEEEAELSASNLRPLRSAGFGTSTGLDNQNGLELNDYDQDLTLPAEED